MNFSSELSYGPLNRLKILPQSMGTFSTIGQPILRTFIVRSFFDIIDISVKNAFSISSILKRPESNTERGISRRLTFGPWAGSRPIWGIHRKFKTETNIFDDKTRCFSSLVHETPAFRNRMDGRGGGGLPDVEFGCRTPPGPTPGTGKTRQRESNTGRAEGKKPLTRRYPAAQGRRIYRAQHMLIGARGGFEFFRVCSNFAAIFVFS